MSYAQQFRDYLCPMGNPANAAPMKAYMKDKFDYLGIKAKPRQEALKAFIRQNGLPQPEKVDACIREFWEMPEREFQYCAMELLEKAHRKAPDDALPLYLYMTVTKSWWDTVDMIAPKLIGKFLAKRPEQEAPLSKEWREDENIWLKRTALLFQRSRKAKTNWPLLQENIEACIGQPDFFIRKAIGWVLREYGKVNPQAVLQFVDQHPELSPLSKKEALKHLKS